MIEPERIRALNRAEERPGGYVLYWMQAAQRAEHNPALEYAVEQANARRLPVLACFGATPDYPEANARHYAFMFEGLGETRRTLAARGIQLVIQAASPADLAVQLARDAALLVTDCGYLRHQRAWRRDAAKQVACPMIQVEGDVIVPVETASDKEEYAAATLRPRLRRHLAHFLRPLPEVSVRRDSLGFRCAGMDLDDARAAAHALGVDASVAPVARFRGGASEARRRLRAFIAGKLNDYDRLHGDPSAHCGSTLSPYLHFGHISPVAVALEVMNAPGIRAAARESFLEELIVRRELGANFCRFNARYDAYRALPAWARATLQTHRRDRREVVYTLRTLEAARTHDPYWNAAQNEMLLTGFMHNYMRMYWGKKILEWSAAPERAFRVMLALNNRYQLDGRDPNSCANIAWCLGKFDRPWRERPVFGMVRYMNDAGLRRKFDIDAYVREVRAIEAQLDAAGE